MTNDTMLSCWQSIRTLIVVWYSTSNLLHIARRKAGEPGNKAMMTVVYLEFIYASLQLNFDSQVALFSVAGHENQLQVKKPGTLRLPVCKLPV